MTSPICPLCKANKNEYLFSVRNYNVVSCNKCELFFINPYPKDVYNHVIKYSYDKLEILDVEKHYLAEIQFLKKYFNMIVQEVKGAKAILDVGCGTGHLLEKFNMYPYIRRFGIELNKDRAILARKKSGCKIYQVPIEEFSTRTKFDVIILINVLSHIPSFDKLFNKLHSILQLNGKIILKVGEHKKSIKKTDIFDWGIPDHMHFLGLNTIDFICQKYGFKICKHQRIPLSHDLFSPSRFKAPGRSKVRNIIKQFVLYTPFVLPIIRRSYDIVKGEKIYSSFIILKPISL